MAKLVVWRHGQTDYNLQGRVQGVTDISLNAAGLAQAEAAAPIIAAYKPVKIIASPLERAQQTAQALAKLSGGKVASDERLIERSFGIWEGLTGKEIKADWPQEFKQWQVCHARWHWYGRARRGGPALCCGYARRRGGLRH